MIVASSFNWTKILSKKSPSIQNFIQKFSENSLNFMRDQLAYREMIMNFLAPGQVLSIFTYLLRRRLRERMAQDPVVQKQWVEIEKEIRDKCRM